MNQRTQILRFLESGKKLTRQRAINELGIFEAPARISELRNDFQIPIETTMIRVTNRYGRGVSVADCSITTIHNMKDSFERKG